jgi:dipeptidyl aminopeptidase/acylaminoacyl peptidase
MIHGDMDSQVRIVHSEDMPSALKRAKRPYKLVKVNGANHQIDRQSDRATLLSELDAFLKANLGT